MENPLLPQEHEQSELQKFKIFYEHVPDNRKNPPVKRIARK